MKGLSQAVERGKLVISDMFCEKSPILSSNNKFSFYDTPFIWGILHNFGGNVGMWGSFKAVKDGTEDAFANASSMSGVGLFPEGIDQNPPYVRPH